MKWLSPLVAVLLIACGGSEPELGALCSDGEDNDRDELIDCADSDCITLCGLQVHDDAATGSEDTALQLEDAALIANDRAAHGSTLVVTDVLGAVNGAVTRSNGQILFTPAQDFHGVASFRYRVLSGGESAEGTVQVTVAAVNDAPAAGDDTASTPEDTAVTLSPVDNDTDVDGDALALSAVFEAVNGTVRIEGGQAVFTPAPDFAGEASFRYEVSDGNAVVGGTVVLTVTPVADAPRPTPDAVAVSEDGTGTFAPLENDLDPDGDALSLLAVETPTVGTAAALPDGRITFTPPANFFGEVTFGYTVSDGALTSAGTVAVTVLPVNDAPVALDEALTVDEDTVVTLRPQDNDSDLDGPALSVASVTEVVNGTVALLPDGSVAFTPFQDFVGAARFDYQVSDGEYADTGRVELQFLPVNDAPRLTEDRYNLQEDSFIQISPLFNDTDPEFDPMVLAGVFDVTNGVAFVVGPRDISFSPDPDFHGTASLRYEVTDGQARSTQTVTFYVAPVNDYPSLSPDTVSTVEDTALTLSAQSLLANDSDVDGDPLEVVRVGSDEGGTVSLVDGMITFTPLEDFVGTGRFSYVVRDAVGEYAEWAMVEVTPVEDPPVAVDDFLRVPPGATVAITPLANDQEVDGDPLTLVSVFAAVNGSVTASGDTATFTLAGLADGHFDYRVSDGQGGEDVGRVFVRAVQCGDGILEPLAATELRLEYVARSCAEDSVTFTLNDEIIHSGPVPSHCDCVAPVRQISLTDPGLLSRLRAGQSRLGVSFNGAQVAWASATLFEGEEPHRVVLYESSSGNAARRERVACDGFLNFGPAATVASVLPGERCDDGNTQSGDGCESTCRPACAEETPATRGWVEADRCYYELGGSVPWAAARDACVASGAELPSVHSTAENAFLRVLYGTSQWIGLNDLDAEGTFVWSDQSPVTFTAWATAEPNNAGGAENCAQLTDAGPWNDIPCGLNRPFVCEAPLP